MSLIARFVFDKGEPVDVRLKKEQKNEFLEDMRTGNFFHDEEGDGVFFANLDHARFFYISQEKTPAPGEVDVSQAIKEEEAEDAPPKAK